SLHDALPIWELPALLGSGITVAEIAGARPDPGLRPDEARRRVRSLIGALEALHARCRKQSLSILVPMGGEMAYRYQEALMADLLRALRSFNARLGTEHAAGGQDEGSPERDA